METQKPTYQKVPEAVRNSLQRRLFQYERNLDIYRVEELRMIISKGKEEIFLVAYNLNANKRVNLPYKDLERINFVDEDSEGLAKAIKESFTPSK